MIRFVIGPACSGKTTFIQDTFPDTFIIDLWDFQKDYPTFNLENIKQSYEDAEHALLEAVKTHDDVIFEHTLLKHIRRTPYIEGIKKVTDTPIDCYVMMPTYETYEKFCEKRGVAPNPKEFNMLEPPEKEEGFNKIIFVRPIWTENRCLVKQE